MSKKNAPLAVETEDRSSAYEVAGQWKLMWWKLKKHRMAMIALPIIIVMYTLTM